MRSCCGRPRNSKSWRRTRSTNRRLRRWRFPRVRSSSELTGTCGVSLGLENPDEGQVAKAFGEVQSVADDEQIRDGESDIVSFDGFDPASGLVEQDAGAEPPGLQLLNHGTDTAHGASRIQNIVYQQDVASLHIEAQFLGKDQFARDGAGAVAGHANEIETEWNGEVANEVGEKKDGAIEEGNDDQLPPGEVFRDPAGELTNPPGQLRRRDQHARDIAAPLAGNGHAAGGRAP